MYRWLFNLLIENEHTVNANKVPFQIRIVQL